MCLFAYALTLCVVGNAVVLDEQHAVLNTLG